MIFPLRLNKNPKKVKEIVLSSLDLAEVMLSYGVWFTFDPRHGSQVQYRCPFHGKDNKPSARYYRADGAMDGRGAHCYCWFCKKSWDVVAFIMEKENQSYYEALCYIVNRYNIDLSAIPDEPEMKFDTPQVSDSVVKIILAENLIRPLRGKVDFEKYRILCSALMRARYLQSLELDITEMADKICTKAIKLQGEIDGGNRI